jgi:predicted dehydrogenase
MENPHPLNVGIIGCGVIAPAHVESYTLLPNVRVLWACDLIESKARTLANKYDIACITTDYREMLRDARLDCVSVCTDHASHAPISAAALRAGKHVLCEKALAANAAGLRRMFCAHASQPQLVFSGVFQHRFDLAARYLKHLIDQGVFGTILTASVHMRCLRTHEYYMADAWRGTWAKEGGAVLINQAIHFIDMLVWIMGGVAALSGTFANLTHNGVMETEDTAVASLRFRNGALGVIDATCSSNVNWEHTIAIQGSHGTLELRNDKPLTLSFSDPAVTARVTEAFATEFDSTPINAAKSYYGSSHPAQIADFVEAIRERRPPFVTAASARHAVDVVLAIYKSHRLRRWVSL